MSVWWILARALLPSQDEPRPREGAASEGEIHMRSLRKRRGGFTLIEIMMTVAIIGILASVAIPRFITYQNRSKRTEAMTNLSAIAKNEIAYFGANGVFWGAPPVPAGAPGPKRAWDPGAKAAFDPLGYAPEGAVWYAYDVNTVAADCTCGVGANGEALCFTASAYGDLDGDGFVAILAYYHTDPGGNTCVTAINANPPPVDPNSGNAILDRPTLIPTGAGSDDF
jgi:type IV pilus assembly protein PilA